MSAFVHPAVVSAPTSTLCGSSPHSGSMNDSRIALQTSGSATAPPLLQVTTVASATRSLIETSPIAARSWGNMASRSQTTAAALPVGRSSTVGDHVHHERIGNVGPDNVLGFAPIVAGRVDAGQQIP